MRALQPIHLLVIAAISAATVVACSEHCVDVVCGPAPPPLTVIVTDTVRVDTTILVSRTNPTRIDTVDTVVVKRHAIADAEVTLQRLVGADTVTFDTLRAQSGGVEFLRLDVANLPDTAFMLHAMRGGRSVTRGGLQVQMVNGCCSYPIVGRYEIALPVAP